MFPSPALLSENMISTHQIDSDSSNFVEPDKNSSESTKRKYSNRSILWSCIKSLKKVKTLGKPIGFLKLKSEKSSKENELSTEKLQNPSELTANPVKRKALEEIDLSITKKLRTYRKSSNLSCCLADCISTDTKIIKVGNSVKWTELRLCENHQHLFKIFDNSKPALDQTTEYFQVVSENIEETIDIEVFSNSRLSIKPSYPVASNSTLFILPEMEPTWKDSKCFIACYVHTAVDKIPPMRTMVEHVWLKNSENTFSVKKLNIGQIFKRDPDNSDFVIETVDYSEKTPNIYVKRCS